MMNSFKIICELYSFYSDNDHCAPLPPPPIHIPLFSIHYIFKYLIILDQSMPNMPRYFPWPRLWTTNCRQNGTEDL